ncbi:uncharacterized protein LOC131440064 [Malaya genurostris]|uniref:uncharacterized protein LOC131434533 n=1 Tax=Malaya genurostris TaxID=325434 RepID=UPI0026F39827|nr:uncharacterized protein LOC131434533 [Malaya genurostris]XP_058467140.1 uncharacterized protein LOC131440064 [Malaya genurostris]
MQCKVVISCCLHWVLVMALVVTSDDTYDDPFDWEHFDKIPCGEISCNQSTQECVANRTCECRPEFEYNEEAGRCYLCPSEGHACISCCFGGTVCYAGRCQHCWKDANGECLTQDSLFYLTAAQVALATVMIIGVSALATLLYKTIRTRARNNNQRRLASELNRPSLSRVSLSSIQIRVLRRLRDRPPKYETRHNYEFHQREENQSRRNNPSPASIRPTSPSVRLPGGPPPAYDGDVTSLVDFPPPYSVEPSHPESRIAIIGEEPKIETTVVSPGGNNGPGIENRAYENTEDCEPKVTERLDINLSKSDEHKTIHI